MEKPSIYTIAEMAGVSTATVSRALSGKGGIRPDTRQRILDVAAQLNYRPSQLARRLSASDITIGVLYSGQQLEEFGLEIFRGAYDAGQELADYRVKIRLIYMPDMPSVYSLEFSDHYMECLTNILDSGVNGLVNFPFPGNPRQRDFLTEQLRRNNVALAQLIGGRLVQGENVFSYHSDTYTAGALAAEILWNALGDHGKVCIFTTLKESPIHAEGIRGFREALEKYPLDLSAIYENQDDTHMAYYTADAMLRNQPETRGVFVGSANSRRVLQRLCEEEHPEKFCVVASDLYPEMRQYIRRRLVRATIVQSQYTQSYETVKTLAHYLITNEAPVPDMRRVRPQIVMQGNMDQHLIPSDDPRLQAVRAAMEVY